MKQKKGSFQQKKNTVLLLGSSCSGKSTFVKQLMFLYKNRLTQSYEERDFINTIYWNIAKSMKALCLELDCTDDDTNYKLYKKAHAYYSTKLNTSKILKISKK